MNSGGARIFVIDDEATIQAAMVTLLVSWGHEVVAAGSAEEMIVKTFGGTVPPDLIISDYRLRSGTTGIAAIRSLTDRYGVLIPAMLITGDTAPERIQEAHSSGYVLLHKPVSNGKLRAAIGNLLRA